MRDAQGFDEFYRITSRRLLGYAVAVTRDWAQAQDLVQEAYLRAWRDWDKLSRYEDPEAWLRLVVVRLATDFWRRLGRRRSAYQRAAAVQSAVAEPSEETVLVTKALLALPAQQREAIALHYLFDVPIAQIADDLRVPPGTVKSWLSRGRIALADLIDPEYERRIPVSADVRATADRRARRRAVVSAAIAVLVFVAGAVWATRAARHDAPPPTNRTETPTISPSATPTIVPSGSPQPDPSPPGLPMYARCDDAYPKKLPVTLFVVNSSSTEICFHPQPTGFPALEYLPRPCRPMNHASDGLVLDRRGVKTVFNEGTAAEPVPTMYSHTVTHYKSGGASAYLTELRDALARCGAFTEAGRRHDVKDLNQFGAGPNRIVMRGEWVRPNAAEDEQKSGKALIIVERVGDYVIVIYDHGWEAFPSRDSTVTNAMTAAVAAVKTL